MTDRIALREESVDDKDFLFHVYASSREDEMKLVPWSEEQKEAFLRMQFSAQTQHYRHYFGDADFMVILCGGRCAGRLCVHRAEHEIRIVDIALLPEFRNRGIATELLNGLLEEGAACGKKVTMHVLRDSPALQLYQRLGFRVAEDKGMYLFVEWNPGIVDEKLVSTQTGVTC